VTLHSDGKKVDAKTETLYFIQDKKIVFEKSYKELGIYASLLSDDLEVMRDYLQPILEKLIREHVRPQETETEEQEE
jgi:helix-turn-helix protein